MRIRILVTFLGFLFFLLILPVLFYWGGRGLNNWLHLPNKWNGLAGIVTGTILSIVGILLAVWSAYYHVVLGKGTQVPFMPGHKLLNIGPYRFCRNPMVLGMTLAYTGLGLILQSPGVLLLNLIFLLLNLGYLKFVEEKELLTRYGQSYQHYKDDTPFFWPKLF